jgi:dimethylargininase
MIDEELPLKKVIVCPPKSEYFKIEDLKKHNITKPPQKERAAFQHERLRSSLEHFGCEVIEIEELIDHPNSVFTRDTALCTGNGYIKLRMGLESRRGEEEWMANLLESIGEKIAGQIFEPGTVEGRDVILTDGVAFIGHSTRTNEDGILQLSKILSSMGYEIRIAEVPHPYLHIGGMMTVIGEKHILCTQKLFPFGFFKGFKSIDVPAESFISGNVISIGNNTIIADRSNEIAIEALIENGFSVTSLDLSEFVKGTGGPTCLILPVERSATLPYT